MEQTIIDRLHGEFKTLIDNLRHRGETSLVITADDCFRKVLLLSAASLFEASVTEIIERFVSAASSGNKMVVEFVKRKGLARQYHTLFDWDDGRAGLFFGLFGEEFKGAMKSRLKADEAFAKAVAAFLEVGRDRNRLIHQNLAHVSLEKTGEEIFLLYQTAAEFVEELPELLRTCGGQTKVD